MNRRPSDHPVSRGPADSGRVRHGRLTRQSLAYRYEPVTQRAPKCLEAGSLQRADAGDPPDAVSLGSLSGFSDPVLYDHLVDHR